MGRKIKQMTFGNTGWDFPTDNSFSEKSETRVKDFFLRAGETKRIIVLGADPYCFFQHNLWSYTKTMQKEVCLKRNGIGPCPICEANDDEANDKKSWASFIGYFSVIDCGLLTKNGDKEMLTGWVSDKGTNYQFETKLLGAKKGGSSKPGMLMKLQRLSQRAGGLKFTVWDVYRSGKQTESIGDDWELVQKLETAQAVQAYCEGLGAEKSVDTSIINYADHFVPSSYDELKRIVSPSNENPFANTPFDDKGWG